MFYSYKNLPVSINGTGILAGSIEVNCSPSLEQQYLADVQSSVGFNASGPLNNSCRINYHLSGADPIKRLTENSQPVRIDFGGFYFVSGFLKSYTFSASPNNPVLLNSEFIFFDGVSGSFNPSQTILPEVEVLNYKDAFLTGENIGDITNITSLTYSFSNEIFPSFKVLQTDGLKSINPDYVLIGKKEGTVELVYDQLNTPVSITGNYGSLKIDLKKSNGQKTDSFFINGTLGSKNIVGSVGNLISSTLTIKQERILPLPVIYSFSPTLGTRFSLITILGDNFEPDSIVTIGNSFATGVIVSSGTITCYPPRFMPDGIPYIKVKTSNGIAVSDYVFTGLYLPGPF